jgi:acetate kinase
MSTTNAGMLIINAGSSSIKMALYEMADEPVLQLSGKIEKIGSGDSTLIIKQNNSTTHFSLKANDFSLTTTAFINWLQQQSWFKKIKAIGHRIVHGMHHTKSEIITDDLLKELNSIVDYDPGHLPSEVKFIELIKKEYPQLMQVACFDTAFHTTIPAVAKTFALPKKYFDEGIQRYGFHGISYSYLMQQLQKINETEANGRIILAHLGNGASIAAVKEGKCIDTSMGFTPAAGIVMSTRSGDIDPGVALFLMQQGMDAKTFNDIINHQSGLLGISGVSADMQTLLEKENENKDAALAIDIFCYQIKKYIGAYIAALNGLDILVFSGGIGENAAVIRKRICNGLEYAGIEIDDERNSNQQQLISTTNSKIKVYVIPTNEELMIVQQTFNIYRQQNHHS